MSTTVDVLSRSTIGWDSGEFFALYNNNLTGVAMAALNTGVCHRFMALDTRDIKSVKIRWSSVTAAGTVQLRIETIDATTGKPTGTLYDANAVKSFTPVVGTQTVTFDVLPTTGLTAGTEYAVVLLTTTGGTTQTLLAYCNQSFNSAYPAVTLTAADGTTRSNFAEVAASRPALTLIMDDDAEEVFAFLPFYTASNFDCYGTRAAGAKFTLTQATKFIGVRFYAARGGTPTGNYRLRVFSGSSVVSGTEMIADKDSLQTGASGRMGMLLFSSGPITLPAGTYRLILDQTDHASTSANYWRLAGVTSFASAIVPSGWIQTTTTDIDAGTITWTDDSLSMPAMGLIPTDLPALNASIVLPRRGGTVMKM